MAKFSLPLPFGAIDRGNHWVIIKSDKPRLRVNILKSWSLVAFLVAVPGLSLAQDNDPFINLYNDGVSPPGITSGINTIQPGCTSFYAIPGESDGVPTCTYYFVNNAGGILDGFTFEATLDFTPPPTTTYSCTDFFYDLSCVATFNPTTDVLSYVFSNPNAGIPTTGPNSTFYFVLGNWTGDFSSVTLTNSYSVPEGSTILTFVTEFLLFAGALALFGRRMKWKQHAGL